MSIRKQDVAIKMPLLGPVEFVTEVVAWLVPVGTIVEMDQDLLELTWDGEPFILPSPPDGQLCVIMVEPGEVIATDQVLARITVD